MSIFTFSSTKIVLMLQKGFANGKIAARKLIAVLSRHQRAHVMIVLLYALKMYTLDSLGMEQRHVVGVLSQML